MARSSQAKWGVLLESAARTVDTYSEVMINDYGCRGLLIRIRVSAGTPNTVTPRLEYLDVAAGTWENYLSATALAASTEQDWVIYPLGYAAASWSIATSNRDIQIAPLPTHWRLFMDVTSTASVTYSVGYQYLA
jgi:hypothetical protein